MSDAASAGTFVAAVLETAGYIGQAEFLERFHNFFLSGGALIYVISCIGAVVSVALFGSYEKARYLLVGPSLFMFLVGTTVETPAVIWQLGGGKPRNIYSKQHDGSAKAALTAENSRSSVQAVLARMEDPDAPAETKSLDKAENIKVAAFFDWYTKLISKAVNSVQDMILEHEDDENLLFISRTRALEMIMNARSDDSETLELITGVMLTKCGPYMDAQTALSNPLFSEKHKKDLLKDNKALQWQHLSQQRDVIIKEGEAARRVIVRPTDAMFDFMERNSTSPSAAYPVVSEAINDFTTRNPVHSGKSFTELRPYFDLTCDSAAKVTKEKILQNAEKLWGSFKQRFKNEGLENELGDAQSTPNADLLCQMVGRKITGREYATRDSGTGDKFQRADHCDLVEVIGIFLLRNAIVAAPTSKLQETKNRMHALKPVKQNTLMAQIDDSQEHEAVYENGETVIQATPETAHLDPSKRRYQAKFRDKRDPTKTKFVPFTKMAQIDGEFWASFTEQQAYQTRDLRHRVFTYAVNLPYWQGAILYLLALSYPFLALLVLIPGRSVAFLNVPLAWLWIKSWDIGFAVVRVLDEVLWQLLPRYDINPSIDANNLGTTLAEAMKVDPTFHIHQYYLFLSLALLSVPAITGYACMKGKKAILASFTDGPTKHAKDSGDRAEMHYGVGRMNEMRQGIIGLTGAAIQMHGTDASTENVKANGSNIRDAQFFAAVAGASKALSHEGKGKGAGGAVADNATTGANQALSTFASVYSKEKTLSAARSAAYDKQFGRWSLNAMMLDAQAAAMDGSGTFEMQQHTDGQKIFEKVAEAFKTKLVVATDAMDEVLGKVYGETLGASFPGTTGLAKAAEGYKEAQAVFDRMGADITKETGGDHVQALGSLFGITPESIMSIRSAPAPEPLPVPDPLLMGDRPEKRGLPDKEEPK